MYRPRVQRSGPVPRRLELRHGPGGGRTSTRYALHAGHPQRNSTSIHYPLETKPMPRRLEGEERKHRTNAKWCVKPRVSIHLQEVPIGKKSVIDIPVSESKRSDLPQSTFPFVHLLHLLPPNSKWPPSPPPARSLPTPPTRTFLSCPSSLGSLSQHPGGLIRM